MRVSENWLREWVDPPVNTQQLTDTLTMAGLEVDYVEPAAVKFSGVVVAKVAGVKDHPDAEKLHICSVDDGSGEMRTIICGANNVREGLVVAFAKVGAVLAGNFKIEAKSIRGVDSYGMLCSVAELGLAETSEGILELPENFMLGLDVFECLELNDTIINIDLTPNRSDCLSIQGIAREVSALYNIPVQFSDISSKVDDSINSTFPVEVEAQNECPQYLGRVIESVSCSAQSPVWMQEKLRRAGIRSINAVIDITNYVMLELGQPMHVFDLKKLDQGIIVRHAHSSEVLTLLDGQDIKLSTDDLVIADAKKPIALAGIMGGINTAVDDQTETIFLECASFKSELILGKARKFGLHTDSSHRFERGVDPELAKHAIEKASQLIIEHAGGEVGPVISKLNKSALPKPKQINLNHCDVEKLLGLKISINEIESLLKRLSCDVQLDGEKLSVIPPSYRFDLAVDVDLIEEIARLVGYENIPANVNAISSGQKIPKANIEQLILMKREMVSQHYHEVITFSFVDQDIESLLNPAHRGKVLTNPISQELAVMRSSIWPGLIKVAQYNLNRQQTRIRVFEHGLKFKQTEDALFQTPVFSGLICGDCLPEQWGDTSRKVDFFDIKGDVERLLKSLSIPYHQLNFKRIDDSALHPGQAANIKFNNTCIGRIGCLHPNIQHALDLSQPVYLFELNLNDLLSFSRKTIFKPLSKYPSIRRDITLIVDKNTTAKKIRSNIEQIEIPFLQYIEFFSVYAGKGIPKSKKSISLSLILQEFSRTLTDKEIEQTISLIISQLKIKVGAEIRS